ncbi:hypothetical protein [Pseudomonas syringae]|uniref:hypothetical protein n=1 Tax=Pseudomonas syringae TaxID=317 RepID=UPI003204DAD9
MTIDIEKLEALAKAAKSGGAEWSDLHVDTEHMYVAEGELVSLYEFATPAVLLELCNENEALRGLYQMHKETETREMRELKAELAGRKTCYEAYERVNAELRAECEALRVKSARYEWIKQNATVMLKNTVSYTTSLGLMQTCYPSAIEMDAALDVAMSKEHSHD